jgi:uncharacterized membrane protein
MDNTLGTMPKVRLGDWISEGWNMFAAEWKVWVLDALILSLVTVVPIIGIYVLMLFFAAAAVGSGAGAGVLMLGLIFVVIGLIGLLATYLVGGMYHTAFKQLRGEPISTSDLFSAGERMPAVLGASILVGLLTMIGALLCIIPAFIVAGALYFTVPLVVERRMSVSEAIQASREATRGDLFMFILFAFIVSLIAQAGSYLCYVGMLVTWPLHFTIAAIAYRDCFGVAGARSFSSKIAPPNTYGAPPPSSAYSTPGPVHWIDQSSQATPPPSAVYQQPLIEIPQSTAPQPSAATEAVRSTPTGKIVCPDCKAELPVTARFCARCGRSLIDK